MIRVDLRINLIYTTPPEHRIHYVPYTNLLSTLRTLLLLQKLFSRLVELGVEGEADAQETAAQAISCNVCRRGARGAPKVKILVLLQGMHDLARLLGEGGPVLVHARQAPLEAFLCALGVGVVARQTGVDPLPERFSGRDPRSPLDSP
jgi:hypothetical protein